MHASLVVALALSTAALGLDPGEPSSSSDLGPKTYEAAKAAAGRDANSQLRLALWCEAHGLSAERLEHLSRAVLEQPSNVLTRALLGLVRYQGRWERPDAVTKRVQEDNDQQALIHEYLVRRGQAGSTPDGQAQLAAWCESHRLKEQALAHYLEVLRLDPARKTVWKRLGYVKQGNRWVKPEQITAEKQEAIRQKQADQRWRTKLMKLREALQGKDTAKVAKAEEALGEVTDPRAVGAIWAVFASGGVRPQMLAISMFGQIDGPSASNALAAMAILSPWPEVRARATEALVRRDPRDVVGRLIDQVHKPYKYEVRPVGGPGSPGALFVEGERFNFQRFYENEVIAPTLSAGRLYTPDVPFDPFSAQNLVLASGAWAANLATMTSQGVQPSGFAPFDPTAAAQAARNMAANPQQAPEALSQFLNDPNSRALPPGYTFTPTGPLAPNITLGPQTVHPGGVSPNPMHPTASQYRDLEASGRQLRAQGNNPLSLWGMATQLQNLEYGHPNAQAATAGAYAVMSQAQIAAQRDVQIGQELEQVRQENRNLQQQLAQDVQFIKAVNEGSRRTNSRILPLLKAITGVELGDDNRAWRRWWTDQLYGSPGSHAPQEGSRSLGSPKDPAVPAGQATTDNEAAKSPEATVPIRACFTAGTMVQTLDGPRPIESLEMGTSVLCQDVATGELAYQPILAVYHKKASPTLRISAGGESLAVTGLQRFWRSSKGWTMARDLKAGDRLRTLGGVAEVASIEAVPPQPVYSVDVAEERDLFVGSKGFLVHDFGFVPSVPEPFDRQPEAKATAASKPTTTSSKPAATSKPVPRSRPRPGS